MHSNVMTNPYLVESVEVRPNPPADVHTLIVTEAARDGHTSEVAVSLSPDQWQRIVDKLADLGVTAANTAVIPL